MAKKILNITALILALFSIYLLACFFIKSQIQQQLNHLKSHINPYASFSYDSISFKGFPKQKVYIQNIKISIQSLDIILSILLTYNIFNNSINIEIPDKFLAIQDSKNNAAICKVNAQYYIKPSNNLLLKILKFNSFFGLIKTPHTYLADFIYQDNGITCNNIVVMKKNYLHISTILNKQKSNTNYKINIDINDNQNQSFIVKDLSININNIKNYYNVKINIPNITLNNKYFNILVNGNVLFPIFNALINNKFFIYDGLITFKINNYKNALKFLFEQFNNITIPNIDLSLPSHYLENIYKTLYEAANVKDNNNIAITLKGNTSNNTLLIGSLSYEEFLAKILVNTSTHKKE